MIKCFLESNCRYTRETTLNRSELNKVVSYLRLNNGCDCDESFRTVKKKMLLE